MAPDETLWPEVVAETETQPVPQTRRVLLAEDDAEMCRMLGEILREDGYQVVAADNGTALYDHIRALRGSVRNGRFFDVDMIISDIRMPGMTGLKVLAELRKYDRATPVVLITAFGDQQTHMEAYRLGVSAVFDKPFELDAFRSFIRQLVPPRTNDICDLFP